MKLFAQPFRQVFLLAFALVLPASSGGAQAPAISNAAKQAMSEGRYADAEAIYRRKLKTAPASPELHTDLGIALGLQGKSDAAISEYKLVLRQGYQPKAYALLAREHCRQGDFVDARPMLTRIAEQDEARPELLSLVAPCYLDANDPVAAVRVYRALAGSSAISGDVAAVQLARAYLLSAQFFFARLNTESGNEPYVEALQAAREGKAGDAHGAYAQAAARSPFFKPDLPYPQLIESWQAHPRDAALLYLLVVKSGEESIQTAEEASRAYPGSPYVAQLMAEVTAQQGKRVEAIAQFQALLQTHPELPRLRQQLGMLYIQEQDWANALAIFQQQLAAHPDDAQAIARVSQCLGGLERYEEVKNFLTPRADARLAPLWLRLDLAFALQKLQDTAGATHQLVLAEKDYPADKTTHYRLMRLYAAAGDMEASARENALFRAAK